MFLTVGYCWVMVSSFCVAMSDNPEILLPCVVRKDTVKGSMGPIESGRPLNFTTTTYWSGPILSDWGFRLSWGN